MRRSIAAMVLVSCTLITGCSSGAAPTPRIIYVTPAPTSSPPAAPTPTPTTTPEPIVVASATAAVEDKYAAFQFEVLNTTNLLKEAAQMYSNAGSAALYVGWANAIDGTLADAVAWLDSHPADACYKAAWDAVRAQMVLLRRMPPLMRDAAAGSAKAESEMVALNQQSTDAAHKSQAAVDAVDLSCK